MTAGGPQMVWIKRVRHLRRGPANRYGHMRYVVTHGREGEDGAAGGLCRSWYCSARVSSAHRRRYCGRQLLLTEATAALRRRERQYSVAAVRTPWSALRE